MAVVVIDPVSSGINYIMAAQQLGVDLYIFSADEGERKLSDELRSKVKRVIKIDTNDFDAQLEMLNELGCVDVVLPGIEYAVPIAARLGAAIGRPHLCEEAVNHVRNKFNFRRNLTDNRLSDISFFTLNPGQPVQVPQGFCFPAVVKPVDMAGSINVSKVNNLLELTETVEFFWQSLPHDVGFTASGSIIVEEYIPGKEYSIEGIVQQDGRITIASITEKLLGPEPYFVEIGHVVGKTYNSVFQKTMIHYASAVVASVNLNIGPFHLELRVTPEGKPVAIEIAARLPGDNIVTLIQHTHGLDLAAATLCEYLHISYSPGLSHSSVSAIAFIPRGNITYFRKLNGLDALINSPEYLAHNIYFQPEDALGDKEDWTSRIGYMMFSGYNEDTIHELVKRVHNEVKVA